MRESFIIYRSWYEAIKSFPAEVQGEIYTAIMEYGLYGKETHDMGKIASAIFALVKPQMDSNKAKYENGCKGAEFGILGGRPRKENNPNETPKKPLKNPNETPNVYVNDNDLKPPNPLKGGGSKRNKKDDPLNLEARKVFEEHFHNTFSEDYYWTAKDAGNMSQLLNALKFRRTKKGLPNDTEDVISALKVFLESVNDKWILDNYSVPVIFSKFNEIIAQAKEKNDVQKRNNTVAI